MQPYQIRQKIRQGAINGQTSGMANGYVQCNLVILPKNYADEFLAFCQKNTKPCPLIAWSDNPGQFSVPGLGRDIDIRTDVPRYKLFRNGELAREVTDISEYWRDDLVYFLLGCSFSFEEALLAAGIEIRHISENKNVPMYKTDIACAPQGRFEGNMVVSMRPMTREDAAKASAICENYPSVHGAPIHQGDPALIGIQQLSNPDYGDSVSIKPNEIPVFWACGVTPQLAIEFAKPEFCITHSPGCMLITDLENSALSSAESDSAMSV